MKPSISSLVDLKAYFYITNCLIALNYASKVYLYVIFFLFAYPYENSCITCQKTPSIRKKKIKKEDLMDFLLS